MASETRQGSLLDDSVPLEKPGERRAVPAWLMPVGIVLLLLAYVGLWALSGLLLPSPPTDLDAFFLPAAKVALTGHPLLVYQVRYAGFYPNANGPLSLVPLTAAAALAEHLGWLGDESLRRAVVMGVCAIFPLLMSYEAIRASDRLLARPLRGAPRLLAYAVFTLSPQLWHSVLFYGHVEQPLALWLTLASVRTLVERRPGRGGVLMGLALLARSASLLAFLPLLLILLRRRHWGEGARFAGAAVAAVAAGLLPFWLADPYDLSYSLATFRDQLPVGGGNLWGLARGTPYESIAQHHDSLAVIGVALLLCALVLLARPTLASGSRDVYALLAITSLCFPLLIKTLWPYYFLEPYVFIALWWLAGAARARARARGVWWLGILLPAAVIGCAQLAEQTVAHSDLSPLAALREASLVLSLAMLGLILFLTVAALRRPRPGAPPAPVAALYS